MSDRNEITYGRIQNVREEPASSQVVTAGTTSDAFLVVGSEIEFDETGGEIELIFDDGSPTQRIAYSGYDEDADTLLLPALLPVAVPEDTEVRAVPATTERWAEVLVDEEGEAIDALVPQSLYDKLPEGSRGEEDSEAVGIRHDPDEDEWSVFNVYGIAAEIGVGLLTIPYPDSGSKGFKFGPLTQIEGGGAEINGPGAEVGVSLVLYKEETGVGETYFNMSRFLPELSEDFPGGWTFFGVNADNIALTVGSPAATSGMQAFGSDTYIYGNPIFPNHPTSALADNVHLTAAGEMQRIVSSKRYKQNVTDADIDPEAVLALRPRHFRMKEEVKRLGKDAPVHLGVIAEEADKLGLSDLITYDEDGPEAFAYSHLSLGLLAVVKAQAKRLDDLEARLARLEKEA